jgi:hypothetical protein
MYAGEHILSSGCGASVGTSNVGAKIGADVSGTSGLGIVGVNVTGIDIGDDVSGTSGLPLVGANVIPPSVGRSGVGELDGANCGSAVGEDVGKVLGQTHEQDCGHDVDSLSVVGSNVFIGD